MEIEDYHVLLFQGGRRLDSGDAANSECNIYAVFCLDPSFLPMNGLALSFIIFDSL